MKKSLIMILLLDFSIATSAEPLGRLFSSANERETLNYVRKTKKEMVPTPITKAKISAPAPKKVIVLPEKVSVQGFVKRSDGVTSTVWVNGEAMQERSANKEVAIGRLPKYSNRVPIRVKANGKRLGLKAGQAYNPKTNKVKENGS